MENTFTQSYLSLLALIVVLLPLVSFVFVSFGKTGKGATLAIFNLGLSFLASVIIFLQIWNKPPLHVQVDWFTVGTVHFTAGILLNNLSVLMLVLVSGIALLVHVYSVEYMKGDVYLHRYWAYLGLFCFSMLGLVIADNLLLVYMFWELVGFSSYLLIGFWFTKETATLASKKAFIINRIGDLGFLTGLLILYSQCRTLDIQLLLGNGGLISSSQIVDGFWIIGEHKIPAIWLTISGLAFLFGACAKSAQFPLHTWLPDAMEGPTSVSSLIHAATMVAAGIFLLVRISPLFDETVLSVITIVGAFTTFMAATIALTQNDIKRILAYSTISQLGYMMLSIGVGATSESIFHLATHAFFKCLLFLAAGSVIHSLHHYKNHHQLEFDHQDIRNMGGLKKYMPVTFWTMLLASLALIGFPLSSGYLSKDAILLKAFEWSDDKDGIANLVPYLTVITSWLTTFYIGRLIFKVFFGESRLPIPGSAAISIHESSAFMNIPLFILAVCSLFPLFSFNPFSFEHAWILNGLGIKEDSHAGNLHFVLPLVINIGALLVIFFSYRIYANGSSSAFQRSSFFKRFSERAWYINEVYAILFVKPTVYFSSFIYTIDRVVVDGIVNLVAPIGILFSTISAWFDEHIIDGLVNGMGTISKSIGNFARSFQTGKLQHYLITMLFIVLTFFILKYFTQTI